MNFGIFNNIWWVAFSGILGVISSIITIVSFAVSIRSSQIKVEYIFSNIEISNWNMTFLWILSLITTAGLLKIFWDKKKAEKKYQDEFILFIRHDLFSLKHPFLLLVPTIYIGLFLLIWKYWALMFLAIPLFSMANALHLLVDWEERKNIKENWPSIKKRLNIEIKRNNWINTDTIHDLGEVYGFDDVGLLLLLKHFSTEHPKLAKFGSVYRYTSETNGILEEASVLISLKEFDYENYFFK